ncbi:trypsin-like peptidase domain-containing protein [Actinoplanes sp. N902-109]|uniref:trypsin-like peptidase domain-containing protein n=1 Tax=Actinoplanes sp. (strain N902-109) TaxID=649831 RepID=UPI000329583A|nr:trypsin-like peptidase domain-containing protein [Actinoplanes sp. N902-109]AGL15248.1 WD40 repeat-containing protein [Actinoplanes sp. N902-109]
MTKAPSDSWTVALHASRAGPEVLGTGVVIGDGQVLTCAHVIREDGVARRELWVAFPKAAGTVPGDRLAARVIHDGGAVDVALLELAESAPPTVRPARLRCVPAQELSEQTWWAFGFPDHSGQYGASADGVADHPVGYGGIHLTSRSAPGLKPGFSGGALWSYEYEAVVGLVSDANSDGKGIALTLHHADELVPELKLGVLAGWQAEDAGDTALTAWGWVLSEDAEAERHWLPRARGVAVHTERGSRFRGRTAALRTITSWLDAPVPTGRTLVITGSPGVGKSAVLGRVVTTADATVRSLRAADDIAETATVGSVSCAVHAKGKTALEVAVEIARAAAVALPAADPADLVPALRHRLSRHPARFNLVVDALDEAVSPGQTRKLIDLVLGLGRSLAVLGVQVVVGTRRADDRGDLLAEFGSAAEIVDLDTPAFFAESDLAGYALATLSSVGRDSNPYADVRVAAPVAQRIAALSQRNFLVAGLVARARALHDTTPVRPDDVTFEASVADALDRYVDGLPDVGWTPARLALRALAYAETPGLPVALWRTGIEALGGAVTDDELTHFARTSAANFLVESGGADLPVYRLFHQALNDALLVGQHDGERLLVSAWLGHARTFGWAAAPDYLLRSLPVHAARSGVVDELLADDEYLLHVRLERMLPAAELATTPLGKARAELLQRTPKAQRADAAERAALFSVVEHLDALEFRLSIPPGVPYAAHWARTPRRPERTVLEGHAESVYDVAAIPVDGRSLLASAGEDGTVRLWDPLTSQTEQVIACHDDCIRALAVVRAGNVDLLATAGHDHTIKLWDPRTCGLVHTMTGHTDWIRNLCAVPLADGREILVSCGDDRTVRLWDPLTGACVQTLVGHTGWVTAVCRFGGLVASTGFDCTVRLWDPATGRAVAVLSGHTGWVTTLYAVHGLIASAGYDGTVRLWDPAVDDAVAVLDAQSGPITDLCTLQVDDSVLLAATAEDGVIRLWDAERGAQWRRIESYASWIRAICELRVGDRYLLATAGDDGTVRLWDAATGQAETVLDGGRLGAVGALAQVPTGYGTVVAATSAEGAVRLWDVTTGEQTLPPLVAYGTVVTDVAAVTDEDRHLIAVASEDRVVRLWDADSGEQVKVLRPHHEGVNAVCAIGTSVASGADDLIVRVWSLQRETARPLLGHAAWITALTTVHRAGRELLVSADKNGMLRLWDPDGELIRESQGHHDAVNAIAEIPFGERHALVSAADDRTVRLWEVTDLAPLRVLSGHTAPVTGVCPISYAGRPALASTSLDRTVRIWDVATGRALMVIPVYHQALACLYVDGILVVGLDRGLLALGNL